MYTPQVIAVDPLEPGYDPTDLHSVYLDAWAKELGMQV
jgi:hypothetical protein